MYYLPGEKFSYKLDGAEAAGFDIEIEVRRGGTFGDCPGGGDKYKKIKVDPNAGKVDLGIIDLNKP